MPDRLPPLFAGLKALASPPNWQQQEGQFRLVVALDVDGITQMGLRLGGRCSQDYPDRDVTFQIEYRFAGVSKPVAVARLDWRPRNEHQNKNIGPLGLRLLRFHCSHQHPFQENYDWMTGNGLALADNVKQNLPIAKPMDYDPANVRELITLVGQIFNIDGVDAIPAPPWTAPRLL